MEEKCKKESPRDVGITFTARIEFEGTLEEFGKVMADLGRLCACGLKIDTVPLPEDKAKGSMMIDTVPLSELKVEGLMIGTWPTPERKTIGLIIDTIPLPEKSPCGFIPVTKILSKELIDKIAKEMPRTKIIKNIDGGIRTPHLHIENELVLLDRARFKELVGQVAMELAKDLLKEQA